MDELPATISLIQKCYKLTGLAKIDGICEYLEEIIDDSADEKIIIFAHHLEVLDKLEHLVEQHKWQYMRIDGSVSINERHQRVQNF
jgi:SWI/SNF-related matrix-associated actin-dependent regulator 1 of chromatin subfamily A